MTQTLGGIPRVDPATEGTIYARVMHSMTQQDLIQLVDELADEILRRGGVEATTVPAYARPCQECSVQPELGESHAGWCPNADARDRMEVGE